MEKLKPPKPGDIMFLKRGRPPKLVVKVYKSRCSQNKIYIMVKPYRAMPGAKGKRTRVRSFDWTRNKSYVESIFRRGET